MTMKILANSLLGFVACIFIVSITVRGSPAADLGRTDANWSELIASMDKMHTAMGAVARSGNSDVDFVSLMLPHHQAALDMAKTELLYGKDPQMRRLAQDIMTDQKLEMELMQRWLKQQHEN